MATKVKSFLKRLTNDYPIKTIFNSYFRHINRLTLLKILHHTIVVILCFLAHALQAQENLYTKTLDNGFTIYVMENHDLPQVYGAVAVRAGSKHDPSDATGMAHYLEHLLFKGTTTMGTTNYEKEKVWLDSITLYYEKLGQTNDEALRKNIQLRINEFSIKAGEYAIANEMDRMLAEIGATGVNATTMVESTVYYNYFPSNQLDRWMDIYAQRFQNPVFRLFQPELEIVYEEKNRKMEDGYFQLFEYYLKQFFKKHPYGQQSTIGETEHLKNPPLKKIYAFFDTYYVPNNMALVLCGDVQHEEVFALAQKKFGIMKAKTLPVFPDYTEEPFKGREKIKVRRTPFPAKGGVIGYRLPPNTHPDMPVLDVIADLLSNNASAGSIDKLVSENKILMGGLEYMPYNDGGTAFLYFVPKIQTLQSIKKSEKLVMKCLNDIKSGNFSDDALTAVKTNRIKSFELSLESNSGGANNLVNAFIKGVSPQEYFSYAEKIRLIGREDILRVANKYFGENSLTLYSRWGKVKKDKLAKPPFKPVAPKNEIHSEYYNQWKQIPEQPVQPKYVNFAQEIDSVNLAHNTYLLRNQNPVNNVVTMQMVFGTGRQYMPVLRYAVAYLELCGTQKTEVNEFNRKLYTLGCSFGIDVTGHQTVIRLNFPEHNLEKVLALLHELLTQPRLEKKTMRKVARQFFVDQLVNKRSPGYYADALEAYVMYGEKSPYLDKMGRSEFKHLSLPTLEKNLQQLWKASLKIVYTGKLPNNDITIALQKTGYIIDREKPQPVYIIPKIEQSNAVYLVNMRKARQSQVSLIKTGNVYQLEKAPVVNAFNKYFGGDMSSLVFQEVREFRSLAYSTSAAYSVPMLEGYKGSFIASAGTQNDKTNDCIDVLYRLMNEMPLHPTRMEGIRNSLVQMNAAARPSFRNMITAVENWKRRGYKQDPAIENGKVYQELQFSDIENLYNTELKTKPTVVCVTGKLKAFNTKALKKYGPVKKIRKRKLVKR